MEVSLKKAHKIQKELETLRAAITTGVDVEVSIYSDYTAENIASLIAAAQKTAQDNATKDRQILSWIYDIRGAVAEANKKVGIDLLLTQKALNDKLMSTTKTMDALGLHGNKNNEDPAIIVRRLDAMKAKASQPSSGMERYGSTPADKWTLTVYPENEDRVKSLKRMNTNLEEQLTALNASTTVSISADIEKYLSDEGII